MKGDKLRSSAG